MDVSHMSVEGLPYLPIPGETYSLFGSGQSTERYYSIISELADDILRRRPDISRLLESIRKASPKKRMLRKAREGSGDPEVVYLLGKLTPVLSEYTVYVKKHLEEMPVLKVWDRRLRTTEEQYHLYMLEIELTNRINRDSFLACEKKIALLPYCLQDWSGNCKSSMADFDYVCRRCSGKCYINRVTGLLKEHDVTAYIWMSGELKKLKKVQRSVTRVGGVGVACVPELVMGLRRCEPMGIPAIGLPLDANRCIRWTGTFHQNSINLARMKKLLG